MHEINHKLTATSRKGKSLVNQTFRQRHALALALTGVVLYIAAIAAVIVIALRFPLRIAGHEIDPMWTLAALGVLVLVGMYAVAQYTRIRENRRRQIEMVPQLAVDEDPEEDKLSQRMWKAFWIIVISCWVILFEFIIIGGLSVIVNRVSQH